jgi:ubiquinone/menaquinone biosynthesis C-methylase UbiE
VGIYADHVLPRIVNRTMDRRDLAPIRRRVAGGLSGEVLEVGFGSGLNVPHYPRSVTRVRAVDPATLGRRLAAKRLTAGRVPVDFVGLDGGNLPLESGSVDHVLMTWTLCTVPDAGRTLAEVGRVLRPGGALHFVEHGRSPDPAVARWQNRLNPVQGRIAGGCRLDRAIGDLLAASCLELSELETYYIAGPRVMGYTFEGAAIAPAS